jgi:hypothetical protein
MRVEGVGMDNYLQTVVVLRDVEAPKWLPIWIGPAEAHSIAMHMEDKLPQRPLSHDLLRNILSQLSVRVIRVTIHDLQDNTFYAFITIEDTDGRHEIDSRPSDAIALAVRTDAPIFVTGPVEDAMREDTQESTEEIERFKKLVGDLDFGEELEG